MAQKLRLTKDDLRKADRILYHHVDCRHLAGLRITLTPEGQRHRKHLAALGISSKEPVRAGLAAVDASPFRTVFVVREATGQVLYALTKNPDYVAAAKKKKPKPDPTPPVPPVSECCQLCGFMGGTGCTPLSDGSCICWGADRGGATGGLDDELETLSPPGL